MGVLDKVPFLAGYNEQDQMNRAQENQGLMKLSQLMQMQNQQKTMQMQDMEQQKKLRQEQALGEWAASQKDPQVQAMVRAMGPAALPYIMEKMKPQEPLVVGEGATAIDRKTGLPLFTNPKTEKLPWYVNRGEDGKTTIDAAYKDFEAMKASRGGTRISMDGGAGKPPSGYRFTKTGDLEQIPGGPADQKTQKQLEGGGTVDSVVASLRDQYDQLSAGGGITNPDEGSIGNIGAGIASSGIGQATGRLFGTKNQSNRNTIAQQRPMLLQAIMKATGMSAKQMDSNVELKLYLATATDPTLDVAANRRALDKIEELFGSGKTAVPPAPISQAKPSMEEFMSKARAANPGVSGAELQQFYYKKYGGMK
jgi:hypothetical protein